MIKAIVFNRVKFISSESCNIKNLIVFLMIFSFTIFLPATLISVRLTRSLVGTSRDQPALHAAILDSGVGDPLPTVLVVRTL